MVLSNKPIDINNEDFQRGVRYCIEELRKLQDKFRHRRIWNHSDNSKFAPVELSDYLLVSIRKLEKEHVTNSN